MSTFEDVVEWYDQWVGTYSMRKDVLHPADCEPLVIQPGTCY